VESLACATPVVCFRIGGNDNMVEHKFNGYLAEPYESNDLARGISWCTGNKERLLELGINGRQKVEKTFSPDKVAQEHLDLYKEMLVKQ
ncbi:MAG: glycosyltransferase, partial [Chlorobiales bacterium]|nr:glycosyltransferase [Chlorobiales bacterium]